MTNSSIIKGASIIDTLISCKFNEKINKYVTAAADTTPIFIGDLLKTTGVFDANGVPIVTQASATDDYIIGIAQAFNLDPTGFTRYRTASTIREVYVSNDPLVEFEMQANGGITTADAGKRANVIVGSGDTNTGLSGMQLDVSSLSSTLGQLKIISVKQNEENEIGTNTKLICMIADHELNFYPSSEDLWDYNSGTNTLSTHTANANVSIGGKLTVAGLIDPTGLILDEQASTPSATQGTLWLQSLAGSGLLSKTFTFQGGVTVSTPLAANIFTIGDTRNKSDSANISLGHIDALEVSEDFGIRAIRLYDDDLLGIGYPHFGNDSSVNGPHHATFTDADLYPITSNLDWAHDDIGRGFDCYPDGTDWRTSVVGANYRFLKNGSVFKIQSADSTAASKGDVISNWADALTINVAGNIAFSGNLTVGSSHELLGLPSVPGGVTSAISKAFFDSQTIKGAITKANVDLATTGSDITLSAEQTIDGTLTSTSRVLVKDQTDAKTNGIYTTGAAAWIRTLDLDNSPSGEIYNGVWTYVAGGTINAGVSYRITSTGTGTNDLHTIGVDNINWGEQAIDVVAGDGLSKSGQTLSIDYNTTNLKITANEINTIQDISTSSTPTYAGLNSTDSIILANDKYHKIKNSSGVAKRVFGLNAGDSLFFGAVDAIAGNLFIRGPSAANMIILTSTQVIMNEAVAISDGKNIVLTGATGTKIGTATTQKLGFYNATPVIQQAGTGETTGFTAGVGTNVNDDSTFTGNVGATAYRINDIVKALKNLGLLAA